VGCTIQWGISDLQRLRGILEIRSPGLFLPSPDLSVGIFIRVVGNFWKQDQIIYGFSHLVGRTIQWGISNLERLRGILEIRSPGLFLPSPDLSVGIFIRVIGHFWQQSRVIEGFSLLLERGILQLESLAFRYACIDLHFSFSLWRHLLY
jgi:hypothetical protein